MGIEFNIDELKKYQKNYSIESYFKYFEIFTDPQLDQDLAKFHKLIDKKDPLFDVFFRNLDKSYLKTKENMIKDLNEMNEKSKNKENCKKLFKKFNKEEMRKFFTGKNEEYSKMTKEELEMKILIKDLPKKIRFAILEKNFENVNQIIEYLEKKYDDYSSDDQNSLKHGKNYEPKKFLGCHKLKEKYQEYCPKPYHDKFSKHLENTYMVCDFDELPRHYFKDYLNCHKKDHPRIHHDDHPKHHHGDHPKHHHGDHPKHHHDDHPKHHHGDHPKHHHGDHSKHHHDDHPKHHHDDHPKPHHGKHLKHHEDDHKKCHFDNFMRRPFGDHSKHHDENPKKCPFNEHAKHHHEKHLKHHGDHKKFYYSEYDSY